MTAARRSKASPGDERREALVRAAFGRIAEKGFEGLRLREVAVEAGIDHSTLHHYYARKEDLVTGVIDFATRQFWPTIPAGGGAAEMLQQHLQALCRMIHEQPALFNVMGELDLRARRDPVIRSIIDRHEEGWRDVLGDVLRRGTQEGAWKTGLEVTAGVELVIAAVKGVRQLPERADDVIGQLIRLLLAEPPDAS